MANEIDPIVGNWYCHLDKGQRFEVVAIDDSAGTIETQDYDGNINEFTVDEWQALPIEVCEPPENWGGSMDIANRDDYGTEITDTSGRDFEEPLGEFHEKER